MEVKGGIRIVALQGSVRPSSYTGMAMGLVMDELWNRADVDVRLIDPTQLDLPLPGTDADSEVARELQDAVSEAAGVILATPEYHGSYSSVMKLLIENLGFPSMLAGKPVALLGVAAGSIGAIKALEHLRSVCSHVGAIVMPGPVSVAGVRDVFDPEGRCLDDKIEQRIRGVAVNLLDYLHDHVCPKIALERIAREG